MSTIFPSTLFQPGHTTNQASPVAVPAGVAGKTWFCVIQMAQTDLDDPTVTYGLYMYVSDVTVPGGWRLNIGFDFVGGPNKGLNGGITIPPGWVQGGNELVGKNVYYDLNVTGRAVTLGLTAVVQ